MKITYDLFICPTCGEQKCVEDSVVCEDSEVVESIPIYDTISESKYLQKIRKYKFYRCKSCNASIKVQSIAHTIVYILGCVAFVVGFFTETWLILTGVGVVMLSPLLFYVWSKITRKDPHTTFERAKECYALVPYDISEADKTDEAE